MPMMHKVKQVLNQVHYSKPEDDFRILDSWVETEGKSTSKDSKVNFFCYKIETVDPDTGKKSRLFKAVKFARVTRLPKSAKQSTSFMDMQTQVLSAAHEQGYNLITAIANVIKPRPEGLMFLYGVQGVSEDIDEAKKRASLDFSGFIHSMMGTFRVLHIRDITGEEGTWLQEKMRSMKFMTAVRGIPKANTSGEDMGNKGAGGTNLNPDSEGTIEEIITAMADFEYVIEILSTPVYNRTLMSWQASTQKQMTEWYGQMQGTKNLSFNLSIPMTYMTSTGSSQGWSKNYTDSSTISYTQGESYTNGFSMSAGESISQSLGESFGLTQGTSFTDTIGENHSISNGISRTDGVSYSEGFTQGQSYNVTDGTTFGNSFNTTRGITEGQSFNVTNGITQGKSYNVTNGITEGQSFNVTNGITTGTSTNVTQGITEGTSANLTNGLTQGSSANLTNGLTQGASANVSNGLTQGQSANVSNGVTQGATIGDSSNSSYGTSIGSSLGNTAGVSSGTSSGSTIGTSVGTSSNISSGSSENFSASQSQGTSTGTSLSSSNSYTEGTSSGTSENYSRGINESESTTQSYSNGSSIGYNASQSNGTSENYSVSNGINSSTSNGLSTSINSGGSESHGDSHSDGSSNNYSVSENSSESTSSSISSNESTTTGINQSYSSSSSSGNGYNFTIPLVDIGINGSNSESTSGSSGGSISTNMGGGSTEGTSSSESIGSSVSYGQNSSDSTSNTYGTSWGQSESTSTTYSNGTSQSYTTGEGRSYSETFGASYGENASRSFGNSTSNGSSYSESVGLNNSTSSSTSNGVTTGVSNGTNASNSTSQSYGTNNSYSEGQNVSNSGSISNTSNLSNSLSTSVSQNVGENSSTSVGSSRSSSLSDSYTSSLGNSLSGSYTQSTGQSLSGSTSASTGQSVSGSTSASTGQSVSGSNSVSTGQSLSNSYSESAGQSISNSYSESTGESISNSYSESTGTSISDSYSESSGTSASESHSTSTGESVSTSTTQGTSTSVGETYSESDGTSTSQSIGQSQSESYTQSVSNGTGQNWSESSSVSEGTSTSTSNGQSTGTSVGSTGAFTTGTSGSMGIGPSIGYSKSYQWMDQQVKDILELLEYQNERIKKALRGNGAFYTYVYIACPDMEALATAQAAAKSTWQNEYAMAQPLQVLDLADDEQQHLLYHFRAFSADITRENVAGVSDYKYATVLLADEYVAYTHLPRVSEGGIDTNIDDVPKFRVPGYMKGDIYMGTQLNSERYTFKNGYRTQFDYRIDIDELMHAVFTGASRSGKTVAAMRFVKELANARRSSTGKRLRIVIMDPKQDWRGIARFVEPERFRFYSLGNTHFMPINMNPCKIPFGVEPQHWIDGIINIYCRSYGLLERGKQMLSDVFYDLYNEQKIFDEKEADKYGGPDSDEWKAEVSRRSGAVTFHRIYRKMEAKQSEFTGGSKRAGNDTLDAYSRLLERLSCFNRPYSIEYRLFSAEDDFVEPQMGLGQGVDELIGDDDITVFESFGLESTFANFIFGIITSGFYKVAKSFEKGFLNPAQYETVLVIEEANKVLTGNDTAGTGGSQSASLSGQSEFEEILDQAAGYGLFIVAITQKISMMPSSIVANCGMFFLGKISHPDDVNLAVRMIGKEERIDDRDVVKWLPKSPTGWFICRSNRGYNFQDAEPVLVQIEALNNATISNAELEEILFDRYVETTFQQTA